MPILKIINKPYINTIDGANLLDYIFRKSFMYGGWNVDPKHAWDQMEFVRMYWGQNNGSKLYHFIVSFSAYESKAIPSDAFLSCIAYEIGNHFRDAYQLVFGIHERVYEDFYGKKKCWDVHFVMNPVSYRTGERYAKRKKDDCALAAVVHNAADMPVKLVYGS